MLVVIFAVGMELRSQKPVTQIPAQDEDKISLELPGMRRKPSRMSSSTTPGWDVYTSEQLGVMLEIPTKWKRREYVEKSSKKVVAVAFDPSKVATQEEYEVYDQSPGRVWVRAGLGEWASVIGVTTTRTVGPEQILMKYFKSVPGEVVPNPAWVGMTAEIYYSTSNTVPVVIELSYPTSEFRNRAAQGVLKKIMDSVRSAAVPPAAR
jgi:hypothetical protein